ncbi:MAG: universal stress protein [Ardenticatenia bacterium]|nr:MAG: universal stress protein [Ardenticatenia bacterium]
MRPILVPLDSSELAEQALPLALSLAQKSGRPMVLLYVTPMPVVEFIPLPTGETLALDEQLALLNETGRTYLEGVAQRLKLFGVEVETLVLEGSAGEVIAQVADERHVFATVMATHGRTGLARWALGSVADRVIRLTRHPVLLVRPRDTQTTLEPTHLHRLLVPLDGSELSERALTYARILARLYKAEIHLLHVLSLPISGLAGLEAGPVEAAYWASIREEGERYLERISAQLREEGFTVQTALRTEPIADAILQYEEEAAIDLVVMTTHARSGLTRAILGSVTDRVVRGGKAPVLVLNPETEFDEE